MSVEDDSEFRTFPPTWFENVLQHFRLDHTFLETSKIDGIHSLAFVVSTGGGESSSCLSLFAGAFPLTSHTHSAVTTVVDDYFLAGVGFLAQP